MSAPTFELQSHSLHSDGELSPAEVVGAAAQAGVELLALTDHDNVAGVTEARAAAERHRIEFITGVEISVLDPAGGDLHVCGYRIELDHEPLLAQLAASRADRDNRAQRMTAALRELGFTLDEHLLAARRAEGRAIGRPHLAQAVVAEPANAARLQEEAIDEPSAFLTAYLVEGRPAFREREAPTVARAIELIHGAGGLAVWAHPFWDLASDGEVLDTIDRFTQLGLDGIEAFYVTHTREQTQLLVHRCAELKLMTTGSSDFHGPNHAHFNRFRAFDTYGMSPNLGPLLDRSI